MQGVLILLLECLIVFLGSVWKNLSSSTRGFTIGNAVSGILAVDIFAKDTSKILTGGADKNATVFNKDLEQVVAVLKGHSKKVFEFFF